jgi:hypothetical protein
MYRQKGKPANEEELRQAVSIYFNSFDDRIIKKAARENLSKDIFGKVRPGVVEMGSIVGSIYLLNLPYLMVRRPVAKIAPRIGNYS